MDERKLSNFIFGCFLIVLFISELSKADDFESHCINYLQSKISGTVSNSELPCGFIYSFALQQYWDDLPLDIKLNLHKPYFDPPLLQDSLVSPHGKFMLHYDRFGVNAVPGTDSSNNGVPDFIDSAAVIFDYVRDYQINVLGYNPPLDMNGVPVGFYHIYFQNLEDVYGTTYAKEEIPGPPDFIRYTSYIILDNDFQNDIYLTRGLDGLKVTAAHEFNHAIQLSSRVWWLNQEPVDLFLMEMTSTWLEDVIYENINNYIYYLPFMFQRFSNTSFVNIEYLYPYGNSLFWHLIEKRYGPEVVTQVWKKIEEKPGLDALNEVLNGLNSSLSIQLHQYSIWMNFTGDRADTINFFPESHLYPNLTIQSDDVYNIEGIFSTQKNLKSLASRVLQIYTTRGKEYFVNGVSTQYTGFCSHLTSSAILNTIPFNHYGVFTLWSEPALRVTLTNTSRETATIKYSLGTEFTDIDMNLKVYPNPVVLSKQDEISFINIPEAGRIYIFNSIGSQIYHLTIENQQQIISWNLKNEWGEAVSSGVYLYVFKSKAFEIKGKFAVVR